MEKLTVYLDNGTYDGTVILESILSNIKAVHVKRDEIKNFTTYFEKPGIYFLFMNDNDVYVGQTGLDTINNRIKNPHSGDIDSKWHSVLAFSWQSTISTNELLFLENALCEYAHENFSKCLTQSPSKANCNAKYRNTHYHLNGIHINACYLYLEDIKFYISFLRGKVQNVKIEPEAGIIEEFYYKNYKNGVFGEAQILIHTGDKKKRKTIVKAGATISENVSPNFAASQAVMEKRKELQQDGILIGRTLKEDVVFSSQSFAAEFLNGTSANGNDCWLSIKENIKLKNLLI